MILTGKSERAAKALRLGLVDELVPPSILLRDRDRRRRGRLARDGLPQRRARGRAARACCLDRTPAGRRLVYRGAEKQVLKRRPAATTPRRSPRSRRCGSAWSTGSPPGWPRSTAPSASSR